MAFPQLAPPARKTIPLEIGAFCRVLPNYPCCFGETSVIWGGQKPGTASMDHSAKKNQDVIDAYLGVAH